MMNKRIVMIGAGNVAHHLAPALLKAGLNLCQIYSRSIESARALGVKTGIAYTTDLFAIYPDCDIYIFCVSDDSLLSLFKSIRIKKEAIIIHTSGSLSLDIFKSSASYYGVMYPLQTFSKKRDLDFMEVPLCIEASDPKVLDMIRKLSGYLSRNVQEISSEKRKKLHLAGVIANNFTNHLYMMAGKILEEEGMDFSLLKPLIFETAHKVMLLSPYEAQTGPARRGDGNILELHKSLLKKDRKLAALYNLISDSVQKTYVKNEEKEEVGDKSQMLSLW